MDGCRYQQQHDEGLQFSPLTAVDDATSSVVNSPFCEQEGAGSCLLAMQSPVQHRGIPLALYAGYLPVFQWLSEVMLEVSVVRARALGVASHTGFSVPSIPVL